MNNDGNLSHFFLTFKRNTDWKTRLDLFWTLTQIFWSKKLSMTQVTPVFFFKTLSGSNIFQSSSPTNIETKKQPTSSASQIFSSLPPQPFWACDHNLWPNRCHSRVQYIEEGHCCPPAAGDPNQKTAVEACSANWICTPFAQLPGPSFGTKTSKLSSILRHITYQLEHTNISINLFWFSEAQKPQKLRSPSWVVSPRQLPSCT